MKNWLLTIDDLLADHPVGDITKEGRIYKFVQVDGGYRFVEILGWGGPNHSDLVESGEEARSAGNIRVSPNSWRVIQWDSISLGICATSADVEALTALLGRPEQE